MARKKQRSKVKISVEVILALFLLALVAATVCYFLIPEFKKNVDGYFQQVFGGKTPANLAKGEHELRVHYLDVGQGDCIFIEFPDDTVMLIDSGNRNNDDAAYITGYLEERDVTVIDYLMLTHPDSDHVGNMVQVLDAFEVEKAYVPYIEEGVITSNVYNNFVAALNAKTYKTEGGGTAACEIEISQMGELIESENETDEFFMAFLSPSPRGMYEDGEYEKLNAKKNNRVSDDRNGVSPITYLEYMGKRLMFTGDVTGKPAERVMERYNSGVYRNMFPNGEGYYSVDLSGGADVYKVAHHGSRLEGCNSTAFLQFVKPKYAICCVKEGSYNDMPASALKSDLAELGTKLYRTDENGTVVVTVSPDSENIALYLTRQDQTIGKEEEIAAATAYFVGRRKIMVNCGFAAAIA
ncbi:MAG: hypothetical protein DBX59_00620 [Bacillota bacterium]|nr:MAG: hypothetical protein DBX59_00620 [Bacillota bacterium]